MTLSETPNPDRCQSYPDATISPETLFRQIAELKPGQRILVAVAGPPASGKSTFAHHLCVRLQAEGRSAAVVPMDGFHFDDQVLTTRGDLPRKGAPWTFDVGGFSALVERLAANTEDMIYVPVFDRSLEVSRAAGVAVTSDTEVLVIEGNYVLLDNPAWAGAAQYYDFTVMLCVDFPTLEQRLMYRWLGLGLTQEHARAKTMTNDLANAEIVLTKSRKADAYLANASQN